jgi:large subunit ribosomal protein L5
MNKIRKGDQVIVLTGRDKGRRGTVLSRVDEERLIVEGVNVVKKHVKPNPMKGVTGGVIDKTLSIHQSNVAIFNPATGKADRVGIKLFSDDEKKSRKTSSAARACSARAAKRSRFKEALMARLQEFYRDKVVPDLIKKFGYTSTMQAPRITKITLNMGVSEAVSDKKVMDHAVSDLSKIAGQKPVVTKSKKAIAGFKIRDGVPIGCMVTLRGVRMYEFLDRFVTIALPRVRDFRGISSRAFDGRGNYNVGVKEQIIFPELDYDKIDVLRGLNISITTTAKTDEECRALLTSFKFPFKT